MSIWAILAIVTMASSLVGGAIAFGMLKQKTDDQKGKIDEANKDAQAWADAPHNDDDFDKRLRDHSGKNAS